MDYFHRLLNSVVDRVVNRLVGEYGVLLSPQKLLRLDAVNSTLRIMKSNMADAIVLRDRYEVLDYALEKVGTDGAYLEFGVRNGDTINFIASRKTSERIYGFDSFEGLPEDWSGYAARKGEFSVSKMPRVAKNVELLVGWFDASLPKFLSSSVVHSVAFIHVDSDLYSSAACILENLADYIKAGTVIVFDEYFNYPNWEHHEHKAFMEFVAKHNVKFKYAAIGYHQVAVIIE